MAEAAIRLSLSPRAERLQLPSKSQIRSIGWWLLVLSLTGQLLSYASMAVTGSGLAIASFWMFAPTGVAGLAMWLTGVIEDRLILLIAALGPR
jgi:hypothetical protein